MQTITIQDIVKGNRKALDDGKLIADLPSEMFPAKPIHLGEMRCIYVFGKPEDGYGCSIGVLLEPEIRAILAKSSQNGFAIGSLTNFWEASPVGNKGARSVKLVDFLPNTDAALLTQKFHDSWSKRLSLSDNYEWVKHHHSLGAAFVEKNGITRNTPITKEIFRKWIDYLDKNFPE